MTSPTTRPDDHSTIISADCHAGANHGTSRNPIRDPQDGRREALLRAARDRRA